MEEAKSDLIRWRRHTLRSRLVTYGFLLVVFLYLSWTEVAGEGQGPPWGLGMMIFAGLFGLRRFLPRWQIEMISPRPQAPEHKRAYRNLQLMQVALLAGFGVPWLGMLVTPAHSRAHIIAAIVGGLGFAVFVISQPFFGAAYQRLFRKIGATEGAYGF